MELSIGYYDYDFTRLLSSSETIESESHFIFIVVNQPINDELQFLRLWNRAYLRIIVDGAADEVAPVLMKNKDSRLADVVIGDLDSCTDDSLSYFQRSGAHIIRIDDCDTTDFQKALILLNMNAYDIISLFNCSRANKPIINHESTSYHTVYSSKSSSNPVSSSSPPSPPMVCLCYGAFGGRLDQVMGNINSLYSFRSPAFRVILCGDGNVCELLDGIAVLNVAAVRVHAHTLPKKTYAYCGYYPLLGETKVATRGLEWDLGTIPDEQYKQAALLASSAQTSVPDIMSSNNDGSKDVPAHGAGGNTSQDITSHTRSLVINPDHLHPVQFSALLSTNNHISDDNLTIITEKPIVWSTYFER